MSKLVKEKFFYSHTAHIMELLSGSLAVSQSPAETARPWYGSWGQDVAWCACLPPSLITEANMHERHVQDYI